MKRQRSSTLNRNLHETGFGALAAWPSRSLRAAAESVAPPQRRPYCVTLGCKSPTGANESTVATESDDEEDPRIRRMRLEAVLLLTKTPLSPRKLSQLAHLADATEARTLVRQLNRTYETFGRAMRVEQVAGGYRLMTRPSLAPWLARLGHLPDPVRLSIPMMETLAVVAYRQPVSRASAEAVRGVACGELLRQLMERELIRIVGRSEELGRPYLYGTTKRFLQLFGLPNAEALPPIEWQTLQEDQIAEDSPLDDLSTSTKEPVVSTSVAAVLAEADSEIVVATAVMADPSRPAETQEARAVLDDDADDDAVLDDDTDADDDEEDVDEDSDWDDEDDDDWDLDDDDDTDDDGADDDDGDDTDDDDELDAEESEWKEVDDDDDEELDDDEDDDDWDDDDEEEQDWD